jgi:hypothetical protein
VVGEYYGVSGKHETLLWVEGDNQMGYWVFNGEVEENWRQNTLTMLYFDGKLKLNKKDKK